MKQTRSLINGLVVCGLAWAMVSTVSAQTKEMSAKVTRISGSARYSTGVNNWQPLKVGAVLKPGAVIQTGMENGSFVDVVLGSEEGGVFLPARNGYSGVQGSGIGNNGISYAAPTPSTQNTVRIGANSLLGIDKLTSTQTGADLVTETQLDLKAGQITGNVKKMTAASKYEVKMPNGVAGIRGTIFTIDANTGTISVADGSVVVAFVVGSDTVTKVITAGQSFSVTAYIQTVNAQPGQTPPPTTGISSLTPEQVQTIIATANSSGSISAPTTVTVPVNQNQNVVVEVSPTGGH